LQYKPKITFLKNVKGDTMNKRAIGVVAVTVAVVFTAFITVAVVFTAFISYPSNDGLNSAKIGENKNVPEEVLEYYESGELKHRYFYNKEIVSKVGVETFYYRNGRINKTNNWKYGKLHGKTIVFYPSGEKYIESNYKGGQLNGTYTVFSKNSQNNGIKQYVYKRGVISSEKSMDAGQASTLSNESLSKTPSNSVEVEQAMKHYGAVKAAYDSAVVRQEQLDIEAKNRPFYSKFLDAFIAKDALQNRERAKHIKELCEAVYDAAADVTESKCLKFNQSRESFESHRLNALEKTVGMFLTSLDDMGQQNKAKEYKVLGDFGIDPEKLEYMRSVESSGSATLVSTELASTDAIGATEAAGVGVVAPTLLYYGVSKTAAASTGTAINALHGVAARNATLAWLGGGAKWAGGAGMIGGRIVLGAVGVLSTGLTVSLYYSNKLTDAQKYQNDVDTTITQMKNAWAVLDTIEKRFNELSVATSALANRIVWQLEFLEPLTIDFNATDAYYNSVFQKTDSLMKTMSDLALTPILRNEEISNESAKIITTTYAILGKEQ
jgi:antitoxin component YwqK of YwqJK toxin-antitoxin module